MNIQTEKPNINHGYIKCMSGGVVTAPTNTAGTPVAVLNQNSGGFQQWSFTNDGHILLDPSSSELCLSVSSNSIQDGSQVSLESKGASGFLQTWGINGETSQLYLFGNNNYLLNNGAGGTSGPIMCVSKSSDVKWTLPLTTQKATYTFSLTPGLKLTITFVETKNVTLTVKNKTTIKDAGFHVPKQDTDSNGHPQMTYGSSSSNTVTYPTLELEIACASSDSSHWLQTELKVKNGFTTGSEPEYGQATVGIIPGKQRWTYLENEKHRNWITKPTNNPNFIAISPPQKASGISHQYQELNPDIVSLLDVVTPSATFTVKHPAKNFLFRGNEPLTVPTSSDGPQTVDFKGLHTIMSKRYYDATGEKFPAHRSDYLFHDVCLRNPNRDNHQETHAFDLSQSTPLEPTLSSLTDGSYKTDMWLTSSHAPNGAKMCWWPVEPSGTPYNNTNFLFYLDKWAGATLHELLNTAHNTSHVYYIHCANGHDRTGLVAYSYFIARGESQKDAYILGSTVCVSDENKASCVSLKRDRKPEPGSPISKHKVRIFPGGGSGPYFETISNIGSAGSMSWGDNKYVDKEPYGVFEDS